MNDLARFDSLDWVIATGLPGGPCSRCSCPLPVLGYRPVQSDGCGWNQPASVSHARS